MSLDPPAEAESSAEPTLASRVGKARHAQSAALMEDYVELISDLKIGRAHV